MTVHFYSDGGKLTASMTGELDHHEAEGVLRKISNEVDELLPRDLVLNMGGVGFMDSSGIAVALRMYKRMGYIGGRMSIENVRPQPMRIFDAAGIDRLIPVYGERKER